MASNQLRVNCTFNYHSCWGNLLIQTVCICLQYEARELLALLFLESRACDAWNHRTKTTGSDI